MIIHVLMAISSGAIARRLGAILEPRECRITRVGRSEIVLQSASAQANDLILIDRVSAGTSPVELVKVLRNLPERPEVVLVGTDFPARERAQLRGAGALGVLNPSVDDETLTGEIESYLARRREEVISRLQAESLGEENRLGDFVSQSPSMRELVSVSRRVAQTDTSILFLGETGVGKEWLARAIHAEGPRAAGPFIAVNCAALTETLLESELFGYEEGAFTGANRSRRGRFEIAHGGTLFLDEIGEIPPHVQVKLLRVLQERKIQRLGSEVEIETDVRLMAATNRDLEEEIAAKRFRPDLYYRLGVVSLTVPPLRERREDIPDLVRSYMAVFQEKLSHPVDGIRRDAMDLLVDYAWPGNVRELINVVERMILLAQTPEINVRDLSLPAATPSASAVGGPEPTAGSSADDPDPLLELPLLEAEEQLLRRFEARYLRRLLERSSGRVGVTAKRAGITTRALYDKMRKLGLNKEEFKE